jgi:defect-in-organelle-trafficking protein DotA
MVYCYFFGGKKMRIKQTFIYLFSALAVLFAPLSAMAFDISSITSKNFFDAPATDKSIAYLSQLFGSVGGVLQGNSGQLLGELLGVLNYGIVLVASGMMVYTVILSVINTAQEGEFMGRGMKSAWIVVRSVMGFGLLVPQATGYSLAQIVVMWAVVQGVGLADKAWEAGLNYLADRGGVYTKPVEQTSIYETLNSAGDVFQSQICAYQLEASLRDARNLKLAEYRKDPTPELQKLLAKPFPQFGAFTDTTAMTVSFGFRNLDDKLNTATQGICGVYSWANAANNVKQPDPNTDVSAIQERFRNYSKSALDQMIMDLTPAAKNIVAKSGTVDTSTQSIDGLVRATLDYENIMIPDIQDNAQEALRSRSKDIQNAKNKGWVAAGAYYRMIASWGVGASGSKFRPEVKSKGILTHIGTNALEAEKLLKQANIGDIVANDDPAFLPKLTQKLAQSLSIARSNVGSEGEAGAGVPTAYKKLATLSNSETNDNQLGGGLKARSADYGMLNEDQTKQWKIKLAVMQSKINLASIPAGLLPALAVGATMGSLYSLSWDWLAIMNAEEMDGIYKIQEFGRKMVNHGMVLWFGGMVAPNLVSMLGVGLSIVAAPFSAFGVSVGTSLASIATISAIQTAIKTATPMLNLVAGGLVTNGMVLSVYIPMIPFLVFAFAAIGWLISVLEAMVAAPLVALGITHPEGHDLMGKAEQATMLLLSVFLRPILMIIGFMAGILLSWVAIKIVNLGFAYTVESSGLLGADSAGMVFSFPAVQILGVVVIYTIVMITILNTCFSLIHVIPQKVMGWIGLHPEASNVESLMHEVKGGAQGAGRAVGDAGGNMLSMRNEKKKEDDSGTKVEKG